MTRNDLHAGAILAQSVHAGLVFGSQYPDLVVQYPTIVCVSCSYEQLLLLEVTLTGTVCTFREPDLDNQMTSLVVCPSQKDLTTLRKFPLSLRKEVTI